MSNTTDTICTLIELGLNGELANLRVKARALAALYETNGNLPAATRIREAIGESQAAPPQWKEKSN